MMMMMMMEGGEGWWWSRYIIISSSSSSSLNSCVPCALILTFRRGRFFANPLGPLLQPHNTEANGEGVPVHILFISSLIAMSSSSHHPSLFCFSCMFSFILIFNCLFFLGSADFLFFFLDDDMKGRRRREEVDNTT
jgi:hypothetical protein